MAVGLPTILKVDPSKVKLDSASIPVLVLSLLVNILLLVGLLIKPLTLIVALDPFEPKSIPIPVPAAKPVGTILT